MQITIVCSDPCEGFPCFECEMMDEAIAMLAQAAPADQNLEFAHRSVQEAMQAWKGIDFNDLDAPYFMVGDEVKLHGREWRAASADSVVSLLSSSWTQR